MTFQIYLGAQELLSDIDKFATIIWKIETSFFGSISVYYTSSDIIYLTLISSLEKFIKIWKKVEILISFREKNTNEEYTCLDQYIDTNYNESRTINGEWLQGLLVMKFHLIGRKEERLNMIDKEKDEEEDALNKLKKELNSFYTVNQLLMESEGGSWTSSEDKFQIGQRTTSQKSSGIETNLASHSRNKNISGSNNNDKNNRYNSRNNNDIEDNNYNDSNHNSNNNKDNHNNNDNNNVNDKDSKNGKIAQNTKVIEYYGTDCDISECWIPCAAFLPVKKTECSITLKVQFDSQPDSRD